MMKYHKFIPTSSTDPLTNLKLKTLLEIAINRDNVPVLEKSNLGVCQYETPD